MAVSQEVQVDNGPLAYLSLCVGEMHQAILKKISKGRTFMCIVGWNSNSAITGDRTRLFAHAGGSNGIMIAKWNLKLTARLCNTKFSIRVRCHLGYLAGPPCITEQKVLRFETILKVIFRVHDS